MTPQSTRGALRTTILVLSLLESLLRFRILRTRHRLQHHRQPSDRERALWLHGCCRRILRRLRIPLTSHGQPPRQGLLVSNHLSHLDILLYGSLAPVIFVAKEEVRRWPLFGKLAANGGTVFIDREKPANAAAAAQQIAASLEAGLPVLLFPEGTSSDGSSVLPFRSPLFEPAMRAHCPITAAAIAYSADHTSEAELAYYGDKIFFPHLFVTLGRSHLAGHTSFSQPLTGANRKQAAVLTHSAVTSLRHQLSRMLEAPQDNSQSATEVASCQAL